MQLAHKGHAKRYKLHNWVSHIREFRLAQFFWCLIIAYKHKDMGLKKNAMHKTVAPFNLADKIKIKKSNATLQMKWERTLGNADCDWHKRLFKLISYRHVKKEEVCYCEIAEPHLMRSFNLHIVAPSGSSRVVGNKFHRRCLLLNPAQTQRFRMFSEIIYQ